MLRDDVPKCSQKVAQNQDEQDEAEHSENVHDVDLVHNFVVVLGHWFHARVLFNTVVKAAAVKLLQ